MSAKTKTRELAEFLETSEEKVTREIFGYKDLTPVEVAKIITLTPQENFFLIAFRLGLENNIFNPDELFDFMTKAPTATEL